MASAVIAGLGALLLSAYGSLQEATAPLSQEELPAVLASSWWCSVETPDFEGKVETCDGILRYRLAGSDVYGQSCTVMSLNEIAEMGEIVDMLAPGALDDDRSLLSAVAARARAAGADRLKMCETVKYKLRPEGTLCSRPFELQSDTRWVLSHSSRYEDEADVALSTDETGRLYRLITQVGPEVMASLPPEALADPEVKALATFFSADLVCESFALAADGTLQSMLIGPNGSFVQSVSLVPISDPDTVRLEPAPAE